jgi:hypothetical protein
MVVDALIDEASAQSARIAFQQAFATFALLGQRVDLTLLRDTDQDGAPEQIHVGEVLMTLASHEATNQRTPAFAFGEADGVFARLIDPPTVTFDVRRGDGFTVPDGQGGTIDGRIESVTPAMNSIVRAAFTLVR